MKNFKFWRTALSVALALTVMLSITGGTIAWFTDSVESNDNVIKSGTLDIKLEYWDEEAETEDEQWVEVKDGSKALFDYDLWEPGYTAVKRVKISNVGTLALKYILNLTAAPVEEGKADLAEVIDVYMFSAEETVDRQSIADAAPVGTLRTLMSEDDGAAHGVLLTKDTADVIIALKMQESAGNEYQGLSVGDGIAIELLATQATVEEDSFDETYDEKAAEWFDEKADDDYEDIPADASTIASFEEFQAALTTGGSYQIVDSFTVEGILNVENDLELYDKKEHVITFAHDARLRTAENADLALYGIEIDGGGSFVRTDDNFTISVPNNDAILMAFAGSTLTLGKGTYIHNVVSNCPAVAWAKGTVDNRATIILEGATIEDCAGQTGTVINVDRYGDVYIEEGTLIANNVSYGGNHGIIRIYNDNWDAANASTLNVNGGEIRDNYFSGNGMIGLYYAKMYMNGGKIHNNSWYKVRATGNGFYCLTYVHSNSQFVMNGGEISGNTITDGVINAINTEIVGGVTFNGGTVTNNSNTRNENKDALVAVCYPGALATTTGTEKVLFISDKANVTGTIYSHANLNGQVDKKYIELSEFLAGQ